MCSLMGYYPALIIYAYLWTTLCGDGSIRWVICMHLSPPPSARGNLSSECLNFHVCHIPAHYYWNILHDLHVTFISLHFTGFMVLSKCYEIIKRIKINHLMLQTSNNSQPSQKLVSNFQLFIDV